MKELIKECLKGNYSIEGSFIGWDNSVIPYYVTKSEDGNLRFWNSSNLESIHNPKDVLKKIASELLDDETGGTVHDGWNELMWETY